MLGGELDVLSLYRGLYWDNIEMTEKKMEAAIV